MIVTTGYPFAIRSNGKARAFSTQQSRAAARLYHKTLRGWTDSEGGLDPAPRPVTNSIGPIDRPLNESEVVRINSPTLSARELRRLICSLLF